jgi:WD40 repeat protein
MPVFCVKPSESGIFFISGAMDNNCLLWRYRKSHAIRAFVGHKQPVTVSFFFLSAFAAQIFFSSKQLC